MRGGRRDREAVGGIEKSVQGEEVFRVQCSVFRFEIAKKKGGHRRTMFTKQKFSIKANRDFVACS